VELDRDPTLALELVVVEHLLAHLPLIERAGTLEEAIGERRLAVVDVRDDAEIADLVGLHGAPIGRVRDGKAERDEP
jgi:hypothetical protein